MTSALIENGQFNIGHICTQKDLLRQKNIGDLIEAITAKSAG